MGHIRGINIKQHYDSRRKRLNSLAFRYSRDPTAISFFLRDCLDEKDSDPCSKLVEKRIGGNPPVFWEVDADQLPADAVLNIDEDTCHVSVTGTTEQYWDEFAEGFDPLALTICDDGAERPLTQEDIDAIMI
ncbi:hypothetical protein ACVINZ_000943 [Mesorhizobium jarvisii]